MLIIWVEAQLARKDLKKTRKILIIIQRSNGDVFLSIGLIKSIFKFYNSPEIDLLVNDDTFQMASLLPHVSNILTFSYAKKTDNVMQGTDAGFIKFGSRVDIFLPLGTKVNVSLGDKVKGGVQIIAEK